MTRCTVVYCGSVIVLMYLEKPRNLLWAVLDGLVLIAFTVLLSDMRISEQSKYCYDDLSELPGKKLGVVLGTAKYSVEGGINQYYKHRLNAAAALMRSGKVDFLLVSGDNALREYDEPTTFKNDLVKMGIPSDRIFLDYAGFRTLDSMVRCKKVFGEDDIIVVSQEFHNERALYIAHHNDMQAVGFNAKDVDQFYGLKTTVREKLARIKTLLDVHVLSTDPKFLGERIEIKLPVDSLIPNKLTVPDSVTVVPY